LPGPGGHTTGGLSSLNLNLLNWPYLGSLWVVFFGGLKIGHIGWLAGWPRCTLVDGGWN